MRKFLALSALLLTTAALSGCGTAANLIWFAPFEGGMRPYGGVQADWSVTQGAADDLAKDSASRRPMNLVWAAIDLPLSALADTITLPLTVPYTLMHLEPSAEPRLTRPEWERFWHIDGESPTPAAATLPTAR
jgi:uncharacterized protein YceK